MNTINRTQRYTAVVAAAAAAPSVACLAASYISTLSHKWHDILKK
jgi:hypothetical protein